jgi:Zn-dependent peptidase ImmA (M78 family)/transcriptional regulator with XRE-family HTH domain
MPPASDAFNGVRLQLAREFRGLTQKQLGDQVAASHALVSQYENGKRQDPPADLVDAFGATLGFKRNFFYLPVEDPFTEEECHFRHRRTTPERLKTQVRAHATLLGMVIDRLRGRLRFPKENIPAIRAVSPDEIEHAAEETRKHWGLGLDAPLMHVGRVLENAGVVIVPHFASTTKIDAFSRQGRVTVIFLNKAIPSTSRWIFDIAHECGHLVMHAGMHTGCEETEKAADRFASAFLLPQRAFSREFRAARFSWQHVFEIKRHWRVSAAAIVSRAYHLELIGAAEYRKAFQYMSFKKWRSNGEPYEPVFQEPELLSTAIAALGGSAELTIRDLCDEVEYQRGTFADVTGIQIPDEPLKPVAVFRKTR